MRHKRWPPLIPCNKHKIFTMKLEMAAVLVAGTQPTLVQTEPNKQTKTALGYGIPPFKVIFSAFSTFRANMVRDDALEHGAVSLLSCVL